MRPNTNIGLYFQELSKDISMGGQVSIPADSDTWPENWKTIEYKKYIGSKKVQLKNFADLPEDLNLKDLLKKRKSFRDFDRSKNVLTLDKLNTIISLSISRLGEGYMDKRVHPSGGARYPLEYYMMVRECDGLESGLYHYDVEGNTLELVRHIEDIDNFDKLYGYAWAYDAQVVFLITYIHDRSTRKYGERGMRYIYLEAGHVGQMLYLACAATGMGITAMGGTRDVEVEKAIMIDGSDESLLYTLVIG
jgi:SagB-type dehydrogenase family enzyme